MKGLLFDALAHHQAGRAEAAEKAYLDVLTVYPEQCDALHLLGVLRYQQGRLDEARELIERALSLAPEAATYWSNLGNVLRAAGLHAAAVEALRRALELEPDHADAANNLAKVYSAMGRQEFARQVLAELVDRQPDHAQALHNLALLQQQAGDWDQAMVNLRRVVQLAPDDANGWGSLAAALVECDEFEEAAASLAEGVEICPENATLRINFAALLVQLRDLDAAVGQLLVAKRLRPRDSNVILRLGGVYQSLQRFAEAEQEYREALQIAPADADVLNNLGTLYRIQGDFDRALECFDRALQARPDFVAAQFNRGTLLMDARLYVAAESALKEVLRLDPELVRAWEALFRVCLKQGRREDARAVLERWLGLAPNDPVALHLRDAAGYGDTLPERCSEDYVRTEFDRSAESFDRRLADLGYRVPALLDERLREHSPASPLDVLDAGCGTGLCAPALRPWARRLVGVDLSQRMLARAGNRGGYDELVCADLVAYMSQHPSEFDMVVAADVLNYFGALDLVLDTAASALRPGGTLLFSLEHDPTAADGYSLRESGRYAHGFEYVTVTLARAGFIDAEIEAVVLRLEAAVPVWGFFVQARRSSAADAAGQSAIG